MAVKAAHVPLMRVSERPGPAHGCRGPAIAVGRAGVLSVSGGLSRGSVDGEDSEA